MKKLKFNCNENGLKIILTPLKRLLVLILLIAGSNASFSQCTGYPFFMNISGFACGNGEGQVCFVTNANFWEPSNNNTCNEYAIEISYPTLDFVYTNIGGSPPFPGFEDVNSNPTVLRHYDPTVYLDINKEICFEGFLTGYSPQTVFTLTVVHNSNPNDIIATSTFTLNQTVTIGNPSTPTVLSQWITPNGPLLSAQDALNNGQNVVIDGTIIVDIDYTFSTGLGGFYNEITMNPGARIEVPAPYTFGIRNGNVHGCGGTWDRMLVQNGGTVDLRFLTVSDADVAVELDDGSTLTLSGVEFNGNDIGVGTFGAGSHDVEINFFTGGLFDALFINFANGREGIHLENTNDINISGVVSFSNMTENGIFLDNTDLTCIFTSFLNCETGINTSTPNSLLNVDYGYFQDCFYGVKTIGTLDLDVTNSSFLFSDYAIHRLSSVENERSDIYDNIFASVGTGIYVTTLPSLGFVYGNNFYTNEYYNVFLNGIGAGEHAWTIRENHTLDIVSQYPNGKAANVRFRNTRKATIFRNDETVTATNAINFTVAGGENNYVGYNLGNSNEDNIYLWASPLSEIYSNVVRGQGVLIANNNSGSDIRCNDMTYSSTVFSSDQYNLRYGTPNNTFANTGEQPRKSNMFDFSSASNKKAINYSTQTFAQLNRYLIGDFFAVQGEELFPFFISNDVDWFKIDAGIEENCPSPPGVVAEPDEATALGRAIRSNIDILNAGLETTYGSEVAFDAKLKLFRHLSRLQQVSTLNTEMQAWYNNLSTTDIAKFIQFERAYQNAVAFSETEVGQAEQLQNDIETLIAEINNIVWYSVTGGLNSTVTINETQKALRESKLSELEQKKSALATLIDAKRQQLACQLTTMANLNASIGTQTTTSGMNLKTINGYLLQRHHAAFDGFGETSLQAIGTIADQCVGAGGEAVYTARALLAEAGVDPDDYNDECIGGTQQLVAKPNTEIVPTVIGIAPNPANKTVSVSWPQDTGIGMISVMDIYGRVAMQMKTEIGEVKAELDVARLSSGIYYLSFDKKDIGPLRLIVVH